MWGQRIWQPRPISCQVQGPRQGRKNIEDERRRSKLPGDVAEDNPILGKPRSRKEKTTRRQRQPPRASKGESISAMSQPWEYGRGAI